MEPYIYIILFLLGFVIFQQSMILYQKTPIPVTTPVPPVSPPAPILPSAANAINVTRPMTNQLAPVDYQQIILRDPRAPYPPVQMVNLHTRGDIGDWHAVGIVYTQDTHDDTTYVLYKRVIDYRRDQNEYYVRDTNGIVIELNKNYTNLNKGDLISVPGNESKGQFVVDLYTNESPRYNPYVY